MVLGLGVKLRRNKRGGFSTVYHSLLRDSRSAECQFLARGLFNRSRDPTVCTVSKLNVSADANCCKGHPISEEGSLSTTGPHVFRLGTVHSEKTFLSSDRRRPVILFKMNMLRQCKMNSAMKGNRPAYVQGYQTENVRSGTIVVLRRQD